MGKSKRVFIILLVLSIVSLIIVFLLDFFLDNYDFVFRFLESLLTICTSALSITSLSLDFKTQKSKDVFIDSNNNTKIQMTNGGSVMIDNSQKNDPNSIIMAYKKGYDSFTNENLDRIIDKVQKETREENFNDLCAPKKDFFLKYLSEGALISSDDLQEIWAKLLIHECEKPNSISKRTLDTVKNLNSNEAELFTRVLNYSLEDGTIFKMLCNENTDMNFMNLSMLQDVGLIKNGEFITQQMTINPNDECSIVNLDMIFLVKNTGNKQESINLSCYVLTSIGLEIKNALKQHMENKTFTDLCRKIKREQSSNKNLQFSLHLINSRAGSNITYQIEDLL